MRDGFFVLSLTLLMLIVSFYTINYLEKTADDMADALIKIEKAVREQAWMDADSYVKDLRKTWEHNRSYWAVLIDHEEVDNIELSLTHVTSYIKAADAREALAEISGLLLFLKHIPQSERLTLENIF